MDIFKGQNIIDFGKEFPSNDACKSYLVKLNCVFEVLVC